MEISAPHFEHFTLVFSGKQQFLSFQFRKRDATAQNRAHPLDPNWIEK
jgi:hypothetical protein